MSYLKQLNDLLEQLLLIKLVNGSIKPERLISCIDLTLLAHDASPEALSLTNEQALTHQVAAICVYPQHVSAFKSCTPVNLATVINFPGGDQTIFDCLQALEHALAQGANEIDYVFPYPQYLANNKSLAFEHSATVLSACKVHSVKTKVIVETGALHDMNSIYLVSKELVQQGWNFIKTSTGKAFAGASLPAAVAILSAINDSAQSCGIKISGGIKTVEHALAYANLAELMSSKLINKDWFRIGASSLLEQLIKGKESPILK